MLRGDSSSQTEVGLCWTGGNSFFADRSRNIRSRECSPEGSAGVGQVQEVDSWHLVHPEILSWRQIPADSSMPSMPEMLWCWRYGIPIHWSLPGRSRYHFGTFGGKGWNMQRGTTCSTSTCRQRWGGSSHCRRPASSAWGSGQLARDRSACYSWQCEDETRWSSSSAANISQENS